MTSIFKTLQTNFLCLNFFLIKTKQFPSPLFKLLPTINHCTGGVRTHFCHLCWCIRNGYSEDLMLPCALKILQNNLRQPQESVSQKSYSENFGQRTFLKEITYNIFYVSKLPDICFCMKGFNYFSILF